MKKNPSKPFDFKCLNPHLADFVRITTGPLPDEIIKEIMDDLKKTYEAESTFHQEHMNALRREQDRLQQRISRLYDDKYDGLNDERLFHTKVKEYKNRQHEIGGGPKNLDNSLS